MSTVERPRVVHVRVAPVGTKDNLFAQITVKMHTEQVIGRGCKSSPCLLPRKKSEERTKKAGNCKSVHPSVTLSIPEPLSWRISDFIFLNTDFALMHHQKSRTPSLC